MRSPRRSGWRGGGSRRPRPHDPHRHIAITVEAFEAIVATLGLGSVGYEPQTNAKGERMIWIEDHWLSKLCALRRPGESYSDVILRIVELGGREAGGFRSTARATFPLL